MQMLNEKEAGAKYQVHQFGSEPHDLRIRIGLQYFNLHRSIAAMWSTYLADTMMNKPTSTIMDLVLEDVMADTFLEICRWMYGGKLQIAAHNFCAVWNAAKKLQILDLVIKCRHYLSSIGSQHRSHHNQQQDVQETATCMRPQRKSGKKVTFTPESLPIGHRPPASISEEYSTTDGKSKKKPVSLEKLLRKKKAENRSSDQTVLTTPGSDEWFTISEEEVIGSENKDAVPKFLRDTHSKARLQRFPRSPSVTAENENMVLVQTQKLPKLAFLVDRSHLESTSAFLKSELEKSDGNCITLKNTDNQTVVNVLQWSLGACQPLTDTNVRATLQLTSQLRMTKLSAKCLEFWRNCIRDCATKSPTVVNSAALMALARCDWPLLGPYPFLISLVASCTQYPAKDPRAASRIQKEPFGHAQILAKAITGHDQCRPKKITIPSCKCVNTDVPAPATAPVASPSKPAIPASIKILGLRRTLELLKSRKAHTKLQSGKPSEPRPETEKMTMQSLPIKATEAAQERKASPEPAVSKKSSLRSLANSRESVRKRSTTDKEIK